ncbi:MAG: acyl-CoA reductase [Akkermansiaceae bacterium]
MTTTAKRAELLAIHCEKLTSERYLGKFNAQDLLDWVELELGNTEVLDKFVNYQTRGKFSKTTKALANGPILHILSGNTPHAGLQSLLRGLLVGAKNLVKLPSSGLPELNTWVEKLPETLSQLVTITADLNDEIFSSAKTVIAIGSDTTMAEIQQRISPHQRFIPHGHKLSIGLVNTPSAEAAKLVTQDACAFNQQGCLSLHTVFVKQNARDFLPLLVDSMREYEAINPRGDIGISESGAISNLREVIRYEAANDPDNIALEHSLGNTSWTAIYKNSPTLKPSILNRVITVQPWPENFTDLGLEREYISTLAVERSILDENPDYNVPRLCPLGQSQMPSLTWHHDGLTPLGSLVKWQDIDR